MNFYEYSSDEYTYVLYLAYIFDLHHVILWFSTIWFQVFLVWVSQNMKHEVKKFVCLYN